MKAQLINVVQFAFGFNGNFTKEDLFNALKSVDSFYDLSEECFLTDEKAVEFIFANLYKEYEFYALPTDFDVEVKFDKYMFCIISEAYEGFKQLFK